MVYAGIVQFTFGLVCLLSCNAHSLVTGSDETVTITVVSENWTTIVKTFPQTRRQIAIRLSHDDLPFDSIQLVTTDVVQQVKPILICEIGDTRVCSEERHPVRFDATIPDEELRKYRIQQYRIFAEGFISIREVSLCLLIEIDGNTFIVHPLHDNIHQITFGQNEFVRNFLSDISHSFTTNRLITKRSTSEEIRYCEAKISLDNTFSQRDELSSSKSKLPLYQFLTFLINYMNHILKSTKFTQDGNDESPGFRIQIVLNEIDLLTKSLNDSSIDWSFEELQAYLKDVNKDDVCATFLLTNRRIIDIKDNRTDIFNGLTPSDSKALTNFNVFVTSFFKCPETVFNSECILFVLHEFGHDLTMEHDPDNEECIPSTGGFYIMYSPEYILNNKTAKGPNNFRFSPCSKRATYGYYKGNQLTDSFSKDEDSHCAKDESDPECFIFKNNPFITLSEQYNKCCNTTLISNPNRRRQYKCFLNQSAKCNPLKARCCDGDCQLKKANTLCLKADISNCLSGAFCDGTSSECPSRKPMPDGAKCLENGVCKNNVCVSKCPGDSCRCDGCHKCCLINDQCEPMIPLNSGSWCSVNGKAGRCDYNQVCTVDSLTSKKPLKPTDFKGTTDIPSTEVQKMPKNFEAILIVMTGVCIFVGILLLFIVVKNIAVKKPMIPARNRINFKLPNQDDQADGLLDQHSITSNFEE